MSEPVKCEIAHVQIEMEGAIAFLTVPAYTREVNSLIDVVTEKLGLYVSHTEGEGKSVADFAMFLLAFAQGEPHVQEEEG